MTMPATTMPTHLAPRSAPVGNRAATIATLVASFRQDGAVRTIYPTDAEYDRHFPGFLLAFGGLAFEEGAVDEDPAGRAAALWFRPGTEPDSDAIMAYLEASLPPERLALLAAGMAIQGEMHPRDSHWYLPWMGVAPAARRGAMPSVLDRRPGPPSSSSSAPPHPAPPRARTNRFQLTRSAGGGKGDRQG